MILACSSPLCSLPHFPPPVFSQLHPHPLSVLQSVHFQGHLFPQAFQEIVQLLSFPSSKIIIAFAETEVDLYKWGDFMPFMFDSDQSRYPGVSRSQSPHVGSNTNRFPVASKLERHFCWEILFVWEVNTDCRVVLFIKPWDVTGNLTGAIVDPVNHRTDSRLQ